MENAEWKNLNSRNIFPKLRTRTPIANVIVKQPLRKMGVGIYPSGVDSFRPIVERGIEIAELMSEKSVVYEVYPFASKKILDIAPKAKKQTKTGEK